MIRRRTETGDAGPPLRGLADVRSIVEPAAARRAAPHRTDADLAALESALGAMGRTGLGPAAAAEADAAFHLALLAATGNELPRRMDMLLEPGLRERDRLVHAHETPTTRSRATARSWTPSGTGTRRGPRPRCRPCSPRPRRTTTTSRAARGTTPDGN